MMSNPVGLGFALMLVLSGAHHAQVAAPGNGSLRDGTRPADGAIVGGSVLNRPRPKVDPPARGRCDQLAGSLREQCLADEQNASGGASILEKDKGGGSHGQGVLDRVLPKDHQP